MATIPIPTTINNNSGKRIMLTRILIILVVALPSWYFSDMDSASRFYAYVLPIITFICLIAFCLWIIELFARMGNTDAD